MSARGESEVVRILRDLLRFDTSNPPGDERPAAEYIAELLRKEGIEPVVVESAHRRASVVARLKGGALPPLMLSAHLDVVPAPESEWTHPPFAGEVHDGYVWGRGAVDMKQMAAMSLVAVMELKRRGVPLKRDVVFAGVADEEAGGRLGAGYLVDNHRDLIAAGFCMTEVGGMAIPAGDGVVIPVQTAERGYAWLTLTARGTPGHASAPRPGSAIGKLSAAVAALSSRPLRHHATTPARRFFGALAECRGLPASVVLRGLLSARTAALSLRLIPEDRRHSFRAMLHDTCAVTMLSAGIKVNMVPGSAEASADGRFLPGVSLEAFLGEVRKAAGPGIEVGVIDSAPPVEMPSDTPLMETISRVMAARVPGARVTPYLMPGFTDAKHYARAGIVTYGFAPVALKPDEPFSALYHAPNERISVAGLEKGLEWLYAVVEDFCLDRSARPSI